MDLDFLLFIIILIIAAFIIAALPLFSFFEIAYRIRGNITNPLIKGLLLGLIWGILFLSFTVYTYSAVGASMTAPIIIICFPMLGVIIGLFYQKRNKPLIRRK